MSKQIYRDPDPAETNDWIDSIEGVIKHEGPEKADYLLQELTQFARDMGVNTSPGVISSYANTIIREKEAVIPKDDSLIARNVSAFVRWNAMAMVARANKDNKGLGGHIASFSSASAIYEVGFDWFFKGPDSKYGPDMVFFQGHSAPGMYARAFVEGRLTEEQLDHFRREVGKKGLSSYPHPWLMPDFWQFPTVSMGLGPMMAMYQARFMKYLEARGLKEVGDRKVWVFMGDGESDEPESLGALSLAAREKLDNLICVVNCNLQRLDGPVRGNGKIIQELEGRFRGAGWNVIKVIWGSEWDEILERDTKGVLLKKLASMVDGEFQTIQARGPAYLREKIFGGDQYLENLVSDKSDKQLWQLTRGGHDPRKIYEAFYAATHHKGEPTVILFKTVKGYGMGKSAEATMGTHNQKVMETEALKAFRDHYHVPVSDDQLDALPFIKPEPNSPEAEFIKRRRAAMGGPVPFRKAKGEPLNTPPLSEFNELTASSNGREISTTMAFVRMLTKLVKNKEIGNRIVPIVPDEARTFGMEGLFKQVGIYAPTGQLYEPQDAESLMWYREDVKGQILEEGITEAGAISSWIAAATSYANHDLTMIPFYIFYSMFGFQRIGDFVWAASDSRAKGFLMGATAGRTTLNGEGLQHEDGHGLLLASTFPTCVAYDPTFSYELGIILQDGLKRMYEDDENIFYYITLMNENYEHPEMPKGVEEGVIKGAYLFRKAGKTKKPVVQLMGSGTILREVIAAADLLKKEFDVEADIWSIPGINQLHRDGIETERYNLLHPEAKPKTPYLTHIMTGHDGPVVISTDYLRAYPEQIRRLIPQRQVTILGTDGFGRSDTREALRSFFEVDRYHVALAALRGLAETGSIPLKTVSEAIVQFGIVTDKSNPLVD
ncbi:MAG: pyruvate dehydrogenase (acetyl-transferring), homodimeric type [Sphaerochaetaceae bacterium]|nr:pyruvate dehydrogenase (acetyl-transferring), homodimeric type [Sphaerochaetaceae bacterium]MDD4259031.1 pyruvate dehydrogenase (acetyl-transferring), homodimeric type [Sphaerochaetaceae bacterium]NLO61684.1 pyruvate dehydrogenase (acetyl-transferring), homodimeric type [Spirochaetales bacterium]